MPRAKPFPRVPELFETLRDSGIKLVLASSSNLDEVEYDTRLLGVGDLIEGSTSKHHAEDSKSRICLRRRRRHREEIEEIDAYF